MPPYKKVLCKKIQRSEFLANMIKHSNQNTIDIPENGWILNQQNEMEIEFFEGNPFPDDITNLSFENSNYENDNEEDDENEDAYFSSEDEYDEEEN